jgi:hypothetical protein
MAQRYLLVAIVMVIGGCAQPPGVDVANSPSPDARGISHCSGMAYGRPGESRATLPPECYGTQGPPAPPPYPGAHGYPTQTPAD